jgi:hypothetical protein
MYYLPTSQSPLLRPSSPALGYSSDPEFTPKKTRRDNRESESTVTSPMESNLDETVDVRVLIHKSSDGTNTPARGPARTAAYQQLFEYVFGDSLESQTNDVTRLVNRQALILDHEGTLSDLIQKIDRHFEDDPIPALVCRSQLRVCCS